jgi:nitrate/nitrite-specific signal transduction histidine kinase
MSQRNHSNNSEQSLLHRLAESANILRIGTIQTRLLFSFVSIVLIAVFAISSITVLLGSREARQREIDQLQSVATLKQAEIQSWIRLLRVNLGIVISAEGTTSDITTLANDSSIDEAFRFAYVRLKDRFKWASESMGLFDELFLMDTKGNVLVSTNPAHEREKHSIYGYFTEGIKGAYIQQPSYYLSLGEMTVVGSSPILENGKVLGVIAGRASLKSLNEIMQERAGLGNTGETYLVGSNHRLLTGLRDGKYSIPETYIRTLGADTAVNDSSSGSETYVNYAGKQVIGVYRWLPDLKVALLAEQEEEEALEVTRTTLMTIGGATIIAVLLAVFAALFITTSIVRPLQNLAATAKIIAQGDLEQIARVERADEIGTLAQVFNNMTAQLRSLIRNLERRTNQLRAINETGRHISSILQIEELLQYVAQSLQQKFAYHNVGIILIDKKTGSLEIRSSAGGFEGGVDTTRKSKGCTGIVSKVATTGKAILINDIQADPKFRDSEGSGHTKAEMVVPIKVGEKVVGILDIEADHVGAFDDLDLFTAQTLSDQLAIAIENVRLYEGARELATYEERQRLARDLHDAVSQTLFSASLIAEVLPRIWEKNQIEGRKRLEEIRQLTRGALAEMRTLLLELRPTALVDAELGDLLRQLAESVTGRARIPMAVETEGQCTTSPEVKVAFYRIAQESLNNIAKHSHATQATVCLISRSDSMELTISDNGTGFDLTSTKPTSLGLGIMRDRALDIGTSVKIESKPNEGTKVRVIWKQNQVKKP